MGGWVVGGGWSDKTKVILNSTQFKFKLKLKLELSLAIVVVIYLVVVIIKNILY